MREGKIIRREQAMLWRSGEAHLESAKRQVADMLERSRSDCLVAQQKAYDDALAQGRQEQAALLLEMVLASTRYWDKIETDVVGVVLSAVRKIFADFDAAERVRIVVGHAMKAMQHQTRATLRIHPDDYDAVNESREQLLRLCPALQVLTIERDERLQPHACVLITDVGMVQTDLDAQLRALALVLERTTSQ